MASPSPSTKQLPPQEADRGKKKPKPSRFECEPTLTQARSQEDDAGEKPKTPPFPLDCEYIQTPVWYFSVLQKYDKTTAAVFLMIIEHTIGNYKLKRPSEATIPDRLFLRRINCGEEHLRHAKRRLEKDGLIPEGSADGRNRRYSIKLDAFRELAGQPIPKRPPTCRPRQEKPARQVVMVQVPGSTGVLPIDEACQKHGGQGAACACPLHQISVAAPTDSKGNVTELPQENLGLTESPPSGPPPDLPQENLGLTANSPPPADGPEPAPEDRELTREELRATIQDPCYSVWDRRPPVSNLMDKVYTNLTPPTMGAAAELVRLIEEVKRRRNKPDIGILAKLATDASEDYAARRRRAAPIERATEPAEEPRPEWFPSTSGRAKEMLAEPNLPADQRAAILEFWADLIDTMGEETVKAEALARTRDRMRK